MFWKLMHEDVSVDENSKINSKSSVVFEHEDIKVKLTDTIVSENHVLGSKKVLMDAAYKLEDMARQMKKKAEGIY
jgi:hypothetical protein